MFLKFLLTNLKRGYKNYIIYTVSLVICVALFYSYFSISSIYFKPYDTFVMDEGVLSNITYLGTIFFLISAYIVYYITKFIINERKKEFGTYILVGIEPYKIGIVFFLESLIIGTISIFIGILIGLVSSNLITFLVVNFAEEKFNFSLKIYPDILKKTAIYFIITFIIVGIINFIKITNINLIKFFKEVDKKVKIKKIGKIKTIIYSLMFILPLLSIDFIWNLQDDTGLNVSNTTFVLVTIIVVIIFFIGLLKINSILLGIFNIIKEKNEKIKYNNLNLIFFNNIILGINKYSKLLTFITISILISMGSLTFILASKDVALTVYKNDLVYDFYVLVDGFKENIEKEKLEENKNIIYEEIENNYGIKSYEYVETYTIKNNDKSLSKDNIYLIGLTDYNNLRKMLGYEEIFLNENEIAFHLRKVNELENLITQLDKNKTISIENEIYNLDKSKIYTENLGFIGSIFSNKTIILNDSQIKDFNLVGIYMPFILKNKIPFNDFQNIKENIENLYKNTIKQKEVGGKTVSMLVVDNEANRKSKFVESNTFMFIISFYLCISLFITSIIILGLHIISEMKNRKTQYTMLEKMGANNKDINKLILQEISVYFNVPYLLSLIIIIVSILQMTINIDINNISISNILIGGLQGILIISILYLIYFITIYKMIINTLRMQNEGSERKLL